MPTTGVGGVVQWGRAFGARHDFQAGLDWRWVDGESQEEGSTRSRDRRSFFSGSPEARSAA